MRRADRLFEIVQILRRARVPLTGQAIAGELEVTKRTVYRDMAALMAQRVPITGEAGVGYVLEAGFDMPPLMLSIDELEAAILGAQWVQTRGEPELAKAARGLLAKIEAVVPPSSQPLFLAPTTSVAPLTDAPEAVSSALLRAAVRSSRKLRIDYRDAAGGTSARVIWPVLLGYRDAGRILAAWCETRGAFRYFRADRMLAAHILDDRVPERPAALRARWTAAMAEERAAYAAVTPGTPARPAA